VNSPLPGQTAGFYFSNTDDPAIFGNSLTAGMVGAPTMLTGAMPQGYTSAVLKNWLMGPTQPVVASSADAGKPAGFPNPFSATFEVPWGSIITAVLAVGVIWLGIKVLTGAGK
jgi:hypothetical protein